MEISLIREIAISSGFHDKNRTAKGGTTQDLAMNRRRTATLTTFATFATLDIHSLTKALKGDRTRDLRRHDFLLMKSRQVQEMGDEVEYDLD